MNLENIMSNEKIKFEEVAAQAAELFAQISNTLVFAGANEAETRLHPMYLPYCVLKIMGMVERKNYVLSAIVEYPEAGEPMAALRAHYESLKNEDTQNYEMLCDGINPYVEPVHPPSAGKWYAARADSFEMFVGLCIEQAAKSLPTNEKIEAPEPVLVERTIFDQCVAEYDKFVKGVLTFDPESVAHRALLISGIARTDGIEVKATVFKNHRNGEVFDTKQQFAEQRKAFMWGIPKDEACSKLGWDIAQRAKTGHQFMKMCANAAAVEMNAERLDRFHAKLDAVGCP